MNKLKLWYYKIFKSKNYVISIDWSTGIDYSVKTEGYIDKKGIHIVKVEVLK